MESIRLLDASLIGIVNAGGDLRAFGPAKQLIWIRTGQRARPFVRRILIEDEAIATSTITPVVSETSQTVSAYVNINRRRAAFARRSAVVRADRCVVADALTKIALLMPSNEAKKIAALYRADLRILK